MFDVSNRFPFCSTSLDRLHCQLELKEESKNTYLHIFLNTDIFALATYSLIAQKPVFNTPSQVMTCCRSIGGGLLEGCSHCKNVLLRGCMLKIS